MKIWDPTIVEPHVTYPQDVELARTINPFKRFAEEVCEGCWIEARIDPALPARMPTPGSDPRRGHITLGPVAVFSARNFPHALSVTERIRRRRWQTAIRLASGDISTVN